MNKDKLICLAVALCVLVYNIYIVVLQTTLGTTVFLNVAVHGILLAYIFYGKEETK